MIGFIRELIRAMYFMKPRIWSFLSGIFGLAVVNAAASLAESIMIKYIIDASVQRDMLLLGQGLIMFAAAVAAMLILIPIFQFMYNRCAKQGLADVQKAVFEHRGKLPVSYFEKHHSGSLVSKILNDAGLMASLYTGRLQRLISPIVFGLLAVFPMFILDWRISSVLLAINSLSLYVNTKFSKPIRRLSGDIQQSLREMTEHLLNLLAGIHVIKLFKIGPAIHRGFAGSNAENSRLNIQRKRLSAALSSVNTLLGLVNNLGLMFVGAYMVSRGWTSFGTLFALMNIQRRLNQSFLQVGYNIPEAQDSLAGAERIFQFLDKPEEPKLYPMTDASADDPYIEMRGVSFGYGDRGPVLDRLSLAAAKGQTVALVGSSGSGKSTAMKLLLGFYPPSEGMISIAGRSLGQRSLEEHRSLISYVPQDAYVFNGTIGDNIRYGSVDAAQDQIIEAAKAAFAHDFIMQQPQGYDTIVGERGSRLSGGQKQRIAIARAFLKNSPILLLDEATSALDSESEQQVQDALVRLMQHRTTIVIAHRLSTIEHADVIYVLDGGRVAESGTHEELLAGSGLYRVLYEAQFKQTVDGRVAS